MDQLYVLVNHAPFQDALNIVDGNTKKEVHCHDWKYEDEDAK